MPTCFSKQAVHTISIIRNGVGWLSCLSQWKGNAKAKGSSACYFLLKHIRNAFAHGGLTREKNVFVIEDKYQGKVTAYGRINHKLLFLLIDKIVRTKK
jgi:hypothetical protein